MCWCFQVSSACLLICHSEIRRGVFVSQVCYATSSKGRGVWGQQHPTPRPPATWIPSQDFGHICLPTPASVSPSLSSPLSLYLSLHLSLSLSLFISISPSLCLYFSVSPSLSPVSLLSFFVCAPSLCLCVSQLSLQNHFGVRTGTRFTLGTKQGAGVHRPL